MAPQQPESPTIYERTQALWDRPGHSKLNWLELEQLLRDILKNHQPTPALRQIDEAIGAFTRRGCVYEYEDQPDEPFFTDPNYANPQE
jgi:hypothetical protein